MESSNYAGSVSYNQVESSAQGSHLPLPFVGVGNEAIVKKVRGSESVQHHLNTLGFVEGAKVYIVANNSGDLIVEVKGTQIAIGKSVAMKVITA